MNWPLAVELAVCVSGGIGRGRALALVPFVGVVITHLLVSSVFCLLSSFFVLRSSTTARPILLITSIPSLNPLTTTHLTLKLASLSESPARKEDEGGKQKRKENREETKTIP